MQEALVVAIGIGLARQAAEPGRCPDGRLVDPLPERPGPHERLVIEAGGQEGREQVIDRQQIMAQRAQVVLAGGLQPVEQLGDGRPRIRLPVRAAPQLDQRVRFFRTRREHASGPVILETPGHQPDPVGEERRGQCVTGMPRQAPTVEEKSQSSAALDRAAVEPERTAHRSRPRASATSRANSPRTISWVSVLRVTTSQDRSPCS